MTYKTDNIAIAAALRCNGQQIDKIDMVGKRATFSFNDTVVQLAEDITTGTVLVDALTFHHELRRLSGIARTMFDKESKWQT